jgi:hypothetical protein
VFKLDEPFLRLIHHFVVRIFHGAGEGDDLQFSIPALLGILSIPSAFGALQLLDKYSTLKHWLMGIRDFDVYRASLPDEYFFIVYSMVVTGAVIILKWDRLFPDRQDHDNLAVLPISGRRNFIASLAALLFLAGLFAVVINGAASVIFPYAVTAGFDGSAAFWEFALAHLLSVVLASFFACFGLLVIMGVTVLVVPKRTARTASVLVRIVCSLGLAGILATAFTLPRILLSDNIPHYAAYIPPVWFLDLHQTLISKGTPRTGMGIACLEISAATFVLALAVYSLTYYRQYMRIPEQSGLMHWRGRDAYSLRRRVLDAVFLRSPFQSATYAFSMKTLFRNEKHCVLFGIAAAMSVFLAMQGAADGLANPIDGVDSRLLSVSLTIAFFTIVSLRALLDVPSERLASWVFRSTVLHPRPETLEVAFKVLITPVVIWLIVALPFHVVLWNWRIALLHSVYVLMSSIALAQLLLLKFRKIPFACSYTASKDKILVVVILGLIGAALFSSMNARIEMSMIAQPNKIFTAIAIFALILWSIRRYRDNLPLRDRVLIFEDRPASPIQRLDITR